MKKYILNLNIVQKLVIFCIALIAVRSLKTGHYSFLFLFWNLFLAWLPLFFIKRARPAQSKYTRFAFLSLSILFLPNAPYILTDLFHLKKNLIAPLWFDLVLILSFSILGIICFITSLELILKEISRMFHKEINFLAKPLLLLSCGYGIYLGRYLRFNSWNVISDPLQLAGGMFHSLFDLSNLKETISVTITFTVFLYLIFEIYLSFKNKITIKEDGLH